MMTRKAFNRRARAARLAARHRPPGRPPGARLAARVAATTTVQIAFCESTTTTTAAPAVAFHNATGRPPFGAVTASDELLIAARKLAAFYELRDAGYLVKQALHEIGEPQRTIQRYRHDPAYEPVRSLARELRAAKNGQRIDAGAGA